MLGILFRSEHSRDERWDKRCGMTCQGCLRRAQLIRLRSSSMIGAVRQDHNDGGRGYEPRSRLRTPEAPWAVTGADESLDPARKDKQNPKNFLGMNRRQPRVNGTAVMRVIPDPLARRQGTSSGKG